MAGDNCRSPRGNFVKCHYSLSKFYRKKCHYSLFVFLFSFFHRVVNYTEFTRETQILIFNFSWNNKKYFHKILSKHFHFHFICSLFCFKNMKRVARYHHARSNDSRSNDALFMHKLCLYLHATNKLTRGETACIASKTSFGNSNRSWFVFLKAKTNKITRIFYPPMHFLFHRQGHLFCLER